MIDEKKLIEDLLHDDGMDFEVTLESFAPQSIVNTFQEFANKMKEGFVNLINAQPKIGGGWIPVSERLPDAGDRVLCLVKSFSFPGRKYYSLMRSDMYGFHENGIYTDDVTHWMPLPEPPKEKGMTR